MANDRTVDADTLRRARESMVERMGGQEAVNKAAGRAGMIIIASLVAVPVIMFGIDMLTKNQEKKRDADKGWADREADRAAVRELAASNQR